MQCKKAETGRWRRSRSRCRLDDGDARADRIGDALSQLDADAGILPLKRAQAALVTTGPFRDAFGWSELSLKSLASDEGGRRAHVLAPLAKHEEINHILSELGYTDEGPYVLDTSASGNSNSGHDYGTKLSSEEKRDLIDYLKTL